MTLKRRCYTVVVAGEKPSTLLLNPDSAVVTRFWHWCPQCRQRSFFVVGEGAHVITETAEGLPTITPSLRCSAGCGWTAEVERGTAFPRWTRGA